jgi:hypothetical protein
VINGNAVSRIWLFAVACVALLLSAVACGQSREVTVRTASSSTTASEDQIARDLARSLIARGNGSTKAAAYVKTTRATLVAADASQPDTDTALPTDELLVVKVYGSFHPEHSVPAGRPAPATILLCVYNLRTSQIIETEFSGGGGADVTGDPRDGTGPNDLRKMGTPRPIPISG